MKIAVIIFHKNVRNYPLEWISRCIGSIKNQTYTDFCVFELDYGGDGVQIYEGSNFASHLLLNHVEAHNYLLDQVFALGFDYAFNINIDDFYSLDRFEKQIVYAKQGYDIISSNFYNVDNRGYITQEMIMHDKNIIQEAAKGHNIIAHPAVLYSRNFWTTCSRLIQDEIPIDDFNLWKRSFEQYKFKIVPNFLLFYRIHGNKVSAPI
ncbi:MAG: hypothetical protein AABY22_34480 [Nanoarchaeota archaeon]